VGSENHEIGRLCATPYQYYQTMMHELRGFIIDGRYKPLDMSNARPRMIVTKL
jgi:hypothetical protein